MQQGLKKKTVPADVLAVVDDLGRRHCGPPSLRFDRGGRYRCRAFLICVGASHPPGHPLVTQPPMALGTVRHQPTLEVAPLES